MSKKQKAPKDSLEEIPKDNQEAPIKSLSELYKTGYEELPIEADKADSSIEEPSKEEYSEQEINKIGEEEIVVETPKEMSQETTVKIEATKREDAPPKVTPPPLKGKVITTISGNRMETF